MSGRVLRRIGAGEVAARRGAAVDDDALAQAEEIVRAVRDGGEAAVREYGVQFGDLAPGDPLVIEPAELRRGLADIDDEDRAVLERAAARIRRFADAQRAALADVRLEIPGGIASHRFTPVEVAGCYAPAGRYPLPSSLLMMCVTARAAGVENVWAASPRPGPVMKAAAAIAGVDGLIACGGAQVIAAMSFGAGPIPPCETIVGPGNRWVTAAKKIVSGTVRIDMLAGPSELVIVADESADPRTVAADLLAQAEHDDEALPILIALDDALIAFVERHLERQLADLPTAATARRALGNGFAVVARDAAEAAALCDRLAPEHVQLSIQDSAAVAARLRHYGGLFPGAASAEVFGDYGAGPNHVLPTGGTARWRGGLSVLDFVRIQTALEVTDAAAFECMARDAAHLARMEGLEGHARAAERRLRRSVTARPR